MKKLVFLLQISLVLSIATPFITNARDLAWTGAASGNWNDSANFSPMYVPNANDTVTIDAASNHPRLTTNTSVYRLVLLGDTLDLNGYQLNIANESIFSGGWLVDGSLECRGTIATFAGTVINAAVDVDCTTLELNGSVFNQSCYFKAETGDSQGGNTFMAPVSLVHVGTAGESITMALENGETFHDSLYVTNTSDGNIHLTQADTSYFKNCVRLASTGDGSIHFGREGGISILEINSHLVVENGEFTSGQLFIKNIEQQNTTGHRMVLTGTGGSDEHSLLSIENCLFTGDVGFTAPNLLLSRSRFEGEALFTKTGGYDNVSTGDNLFSAAATFTNSSATGHLLLTGSREDRFLASAEFTSGSTKVIAGYGATAVFEGDVMVNSATVGFYNTTLSGDSMQQLSGTATHKYERLILNKSSGSVTAATPLEISGRLTFENGLLYTDSVNTVTFLSRSQATGAHQGSFVCGPVKKVGNSAFDFPVGKGGHFRPVGISAPDSVTDAFVGEYFDVGQNHGMASDTTINFISDCSWWNLIRTNGNSSIKPGLRFESFHCDFLEVKPPHLAFWNGTKWNDLGEGVEEGNYRTTTVAVNDLGSFVLAYLLEPGDAPQMPVNIKVGSVCTGSDLLFNNPDLWYSFKPDSALVNIGIFTPDTSKRYAPIANSIIYEGYTPWAALIPVDTNSFSCDSLWHHSKVFSAALDTSKQYLMRFSRYFLGDCPGINDSVDHYINVCMINLRMNINAQVLTYCNSNDLRSRLGTTVALGNASIGDFVVPCTTNLSIDFNQIASSLPLVVRAGIVLTGDYDLLSHDINITHPFTPFLNYSNTNTSPLGTLIHYSGRATMSNNVLPDEGYMFFVEEGASVYHLRMKGAMNGFQDYNEDDQLCAAMKLIKNPGPGLVHCLIKNCELFNFSYGGIFAEGGIDELRIENTYIHRIKGSGGGNTNPKGYGIWLQGDNSGSVTGTDAYISNNIIDECKAAIDVQPRPLNIFVNGNTFGRFFNQETINRHNMDASVYNHPAVTGSTCDYYQGQSPGTPISTPFSIGDVASGNFTIEKSIFYKKEQVITIPYPVNVPGNHIYDIRITENTFTSVKDLPNAFIPGLNNYGGYARISDNYIESCTWDYERITNSTNGPKILTNSPNFHNYHSGSDVGAGCPTCPDPPVPVMQITGNAGSVPGFSPTSPKIPYIGQGDNFGLTISTPGANVPVSYIIRSHPNNNPALSGGNHFSGNNPFNNGQMVTIPGTGPASVNFGPSAQVLFDTNKPGLYGIDAMAVSADNSSPDYYTSELVHTPLIVVPTFDHQLIFNIKDSYYADLYDTPALADDLVYKQVELNGHIIWQEDIKKGGNDWEQVVIDLMSGQIPTYMNTTNPQNTLTFSIAIPDPSQVDINALRGLMVWVDDVYLKRYDSPDNLIRDGGMEHAPDGGLSTVSTNDNPWYQKNAMAFSNCWTLDQNIPSALANPGNNEQAKSEAAIGFFERKSGRQSIVLKLDGIHDFNGCTNYYGFAYSNSNDSPTSDEVISAAVDFDYRDLVGCDAFTTSGPLPGFNLLSNSSIISGLNQRTDENLIMNENIEVESGETLQLMGCHVVVKPHNPAWKIIVKSGGTLEILNSQNFSSRLFACGDMWGGIENQGGTVKIRPSANLPTEIKDALTAIDSDGGVVNVRYAEFDRNYIGINLKNGNFRPSWFNSNDGLLGIDFKCTGGKIEKQPWAGEPSHAHIELNNVTDVKVGGVGTGTDAYTNVFSDAVHGVKATNSNAIIQNNDFSGMVNFSDVHPCAPCGSGVYAENTSSASFQLTIGGDLDMEPYFRNIFKNSRGGIYTNGNFELTIQGNTLETLKEGIRINRNNADVLINLGNEFGAVPFGIIARSVSGDLSIDDNSFNTPPALDPAITNFENTAITIQNPLSSILSGTVRITNNEIYDYRIGIHAINIPRIEIGGWDGITSYGNSIHYNLSQFPLSFYHKGIWLQSCKGAKVVDNVITNTTFNSEAKFRGIDVESSPDCDINCKNTGIALNFYANCNLTKLRNNIFTNYGTGIMLNGPNGASIDADQGGIGDAWDNVWNPHPSLSNLKVDGQVLGGWKINWFHQGADNSGNNWSPRLWYGNIIDPRPNEATGSVTCDDFSRYAVNRVANFGSIVGDSANYGTDSIATRYQARLEAYLAMKNDTTIIYLFDSLDAHFENFYLTLDSGNVGRFCRVVEMAATDTDSAAILNSAITASGETETMLKSFNTLCFDKILAGDTLNSSDSTNLEYMALLSRSAYGAMVHNAAAALFLEIHPEEAFLRQGYFSITSNLSQTVIADKPQLIIYPNPANNKLTVESNNNINHLQIFNSMGREIIRLKCNANKVELELQDLPSGIYLIRAVNGSDIISNKIFTVIK